MCLNAQMPVLLQSIGLFPLVTCSDKFVTKILNNRLKQDVGDLISEYQSAAVLSGRNISDCTLLAHELVRDSKNNYGAKACIKVEIIYFILQYMGFPNTWISWIRECIGCPTFSIMMNSSSSGFFSSNRGIRQGNCLLPTSL